MIKRRKLRGGQSLMDFHGLHVVPHRKRGFKICLINGWLDALSLFSWSTCLIVGQNYKEVWDSNNFLSIQTCGQVLQLLTWRTQHANGHGNVMSVKWIMAPLCALSAVIPLDFVSANLSHRPFFHRRHVDTWQQERHRCKRQNASLGLLNSTEPLSMLSGPLGLF